MRTQSSEQDRYIQQLFAPQDESLKKIKEAISEDGRDGMQLAASEGKMLQVFMAMNAVQSVVEIGTFLGYSALWIARALPPNGRLVTLESNSEVAGKARTLLEQTEVAAKIEVIEGEALESLEKLVEQGPFDMVFIDANKSGYVKYLDWAEKNVRQGGLIVGDNTLLFGNVYLEKPVGSVSKSMHKAMREFNERLADENRYDSILIPTPEGMTVAKKKF